jgi:type VI secretion system secreted protein Hcp
MAVDMFLKIDGMTHGGEARDKSHKSEMDVLSWSWGMNQSGTGHMGSGSGSGKVNVHDISVHKYIDAASPELMLYCCNGKHMKAATLTVRKAGENPVEYLVIKLSDVLISAVQTGGSGGEDRLTENLTLNFSKVEVQYTEQEADGKPKSPALKMGWDVAQNVKM